MDALMLLIADHNQFRGLFQRFSAAHEADDTATMQAVAETLFAEIDAHTTVEEELFYPAVRGHGDELDDIIAEGLEEHHVADTVMAEVRGMEPTDEQWVAKVKVIIESVEHHLGEEEEEMFPKVRRLPDVDLDDLGRRLEARKRELGIPTAADTIDLTKQELSDLAREQQVPGRSTMSKEELAASVRPAR